MGIHATRPTSLLGLMDIEVKQQVDSRFPGKPQRLKTIFQVLDQPLYFVTFNSCNRKKILVNPEVHAAFRSYGEMNARQGRAVGRYVIMPDHIHFFARLGPEHGLGTFVRLLKTALTKALKTVPCSGPYWQDGFFDHVLRSSESYGEKWGYVRDNPVRAGLVENTEDWPYQGEITVIDRA